MTQHPTFNQNLNGPVLIVIKILLSFSHCSYLPAASNEKLECFKFSINIQGRLDALH